MLLHYVIYYEQFRKIMLSTEKKAFNILLLFGVSMWNSMTSFIEKTLKKWIFWTDVLYVNISWLLIFPKKRLINLIGALDHRQTPYSPSVPLTSARLYYVIIPWIPIIVWVRGPKWEVWLWSDHAVGCAKDEKGCTMYKILKMPYVVLQEKVLCPMTYYTPTICISDQCCSYCCPMMLVSNAVVTVVPGYQWWML